MMAAGHRGAAMLAALLLGACAGTPAPPSAASPEPVPAAAAPTPPRAAGAVAAFERRQAEMAAAALKRGHWADAALAWEILGVLRPEHAPYRERLAEVRALIDAAVAERLPIAAAAQRRGEFDAAATAYFEVLALQPTQPQAAEGLRSIERERNRRAVATRFARPLLAGRNDDAARRATPPATNYTTAGVRNQLEHAALLAGAGEVDAAIAVLQGEQAARPADDAVRIALADLHFRRAERLQGRDRVAALEALAACLALVPQHAAARQLQQQLRTARPPAR
jgi:tetratricopeptide (TPR) repeat protein